jgi:hypothetical protein
VRNRTLSPMFLQSVLGPFPIIGSVASSIPLDIFNPNRTAMLIDQLRFSAVNTVTREMTNDYCAAIALEILLGSIPLTKNHVPLGALAPRYFGLVQQIDNAFGPVGDGGLTWHLPKPLYVPPNVQLTVNAKRQKAFPSDAGESSLKALAISVIGRSLPDDFPVPGEIDIPWVTSTTCNEEVDRFVSSDADLVNSNDVPLHVNQFVGFNNFSLGEDEGEPTPADLTVQMSLSNGTLLIRDQIPFFLAFPSDRGILPVNALLQPGAFARLELESSIPDGADDGYNVCGFTSVAMHGYRRIQTPGTLG